MKTFFIVSSIIAIISGLIWLAVNFMGALGDAFNTNGSSGGSYFGFSHGEISTILPILLIAFVIIFSASVFFFDLSEFTKKVFVIIYIVVFVGGVFAQNFISRDISNKSTEKQKSSQEIVDKNIASLSKDYIDTLVERNKVSSNEESFLSHNKDDGSVLYVGRRASHASVTCIGKIVDDKLITNKEYYLDPELLETFVNKDGVIFTDKYKVVFDENVDLSDCEFDVYGK